MTQTATKNRILASLRNSKAKIFLRDDCNRSCNCRVVKELSEEGKLIRLDYGTYVEARFSSISDKPVPDESLINIGLKAMKKISERQKLLLTDLIAEKGLNI